MLQSLRRIVFINTCIHASVIPFCYFLLLPCIPFNSPFILVLTCCLQIFTDLLLCASAFLYLCACKQPGYSNLENAFAASGKCEVLPYWVNTCAILSKANILDHWYL